MEHTDDDDNDREALNTLPCEAPEMNDETGHFMLCPECGQAFDCRKLSDVLHHTRARAAPVAITRFAEWKFVQMG